MDRCDTFLATFLGVSWSSSSEVAITSSDFGSFLRFPMTDEKISRSEKIKTRVYFSS
jgi:hypothetical protein